MNLPQLIVAVESQFLKARRLYHLVTSEEFQRLYEYTTDANKEKINTLFINGDEEPLKELVASLAKLRDYESWPMIDLRHHARCLGVTYYGRMDKIEIISEIRRYESRPRDVDQTSSGSRPVGGLGYLPPTEAHREVPGSGPISAGGTSAAL